MEAFSFGRIASALGEAVNPRWPAIHCGDKTLAWGDFIHRTDALAAAYRKGGAAVGDKVAHLMRNSPAYLETCFAAFKARLVHVNVNYRYTGEELFYILDDSDSAVVVYDAEFAPLIAELRPRLGKVKLFVQTDDAPLPFARSHGELAAEQAAALELDHSPDDRLFIYTGGTTGHPKGVVWEQHAVWTMLGGGALEFGGPPAETFDEVKANISSGETRRNALVLPPLMHGTGLIVAIYTLAMGGTVVLLEDQTFRPRAAIEACERHRPDWCAVVGDAFARPIVRELDERGGDISSLRFIISSGTMWSPETKAGLLRHNPELTLIDTLASSESLGIGVSITTKETAGAATRFAGDENTIVVDENLERIPPGDPRVGRIARGGPLPRGYYRDEEKTAATFLTIDGRRYSLAGDHARVEADGTITLMGRGNQCINSGGEKIFPEEVEEALKTHPAVEDALVFGVPDTVWGHAVSAVVECGSGPPREDDIIAHAKTRLASYKAPKRVVVVPAVPRAPNGKADYETARGLFAEKTAA